MKKLWKRNMVAGAVLLLVCGAIFLNGRYAQQVEETDKILGQATLIFGTDFPMWSPKEELERFLSLGLDEAEQQKILYGNFMNLLHLKDGA